MEGVSDLSRDFEPANRIHTFQALIADEGRYTIHGTDADKGRGHREPLAREIHRRPHRVPAQGRTRNLSRDLGPEGVSPWTQMRAQRTADPCARQRIPAQGMVRNLSRDSAGRKPGEELRALIDHIFWHRTM
jgi:hypothetical protein